VKKGHDVISRLIDASKFHLTEIGNLRNSRSLALHQNQLTGKIPESLGHLKASRFM
jgi:hypothetical protein